MKKISVLFFVLLFVFSGCLSASEISNTTTSENKSVQLIKKKKYDVQVVLQETVNLSSSETSWLPLQIQDKLKSNLQTYLGMKTVVDSKSESALKKLQAASESVARDEDTAIEVGKITTAKFALFTKVRKTGANGIYKNQVQQNKKNFIV